MQVNALILFLSAYTIASPNNVTNKIKKRLRRVSEGHNATISEFPYLASIRVGGFPYCAGALIAPNEVLTSSYCMKKDNNFEVFLGSSKKISGGSDAIRMRVKSVMLNCPKSESFATKLALITLSADVNTSDKIKTIEMADSDPAVQTECTIGGFGKNTNTRRVHQLQIGTAIITRKADCRRRLDDDYSPLVSCIIGSTACDGDMGAPVVCNNKLVGIVSYTNCERFSAYMILSKFSKFFQKHKSVCSFAQRNVFHEISLKIGILTLAMALIVMRLN